MVPLALLASGAAALLLLVRSGPRPEAKPRQTKRQTKTVGWWTDDDFRVLEATARSIRANPADLLLPLTKESGLRQSAMNASSRASGLNQIMPSTARGLGISEAEFGEMPSQSIAKGLGYVRRYFHSLQWVREGHAFRSAAQVYEANFAPARLPLGTGRGVVLYRRGVDGRAYDDNRGFDVANKGTITMGDLADDLQKVASGSLYQGALARLRVATHVNYNPTIL